jgi:hypothetical protein
VEGIDKMINFDDNYKRLHIDKIVELVEPLDIERRFEILIIIIEKVRIYELEDIVRKLIK